MYFKLCFPETSASYQFLLHRGANSARGRQGRTLNLDDPANQFHHELTSPSAYKSLGPSEKIHVSFLAGVRILEPGRDPEKYSGYQVMRLATELVPTYAAILGENNNLISIDWTQVQKKFELKFT